jgi:hypothetical protein
MKYNNLIQSIHDAGPAPQIEAALNDDHVGAGIVSDEFPNALIGSPLFNVATAAKDLLRTAPGEPVIERPIETTDTEDSLARYTGRILNESLSHPSHRVEIPHFTSPVADKVTTDAKTEQHIVDAFEDIGRSDEPEFDDFEDNVGDASLLLVHQDGRPGILKIFTPEPVAITLMPIVINHVLYPSAELVALEEAEDLAIEEEIVDNLDVARLDEDAIETLAPLRYSVLVFKPKDRRPAIRPKREAKIPPELVRVIDRKTMPGLLSLLPDQQILASIYADLGRKAARHML